MKVYRNHYYRGGGESAGYRFYPSKRLADAARRAWLKMNKPRKWEEGPLPSAAETEVLTFNVTRADLIKFLNGHCAHPDNG